MSFELVWDVKAEVSESPVWDAASRRLFFADLRGRIFAIGEDGSRQTWQMPGPIGSFGLCRSGRLVVAMKRHVALFDLASERFTELTREIDEGPNNAFNDGKVGADGCFWVGTVNRDPERKANGRLYRVTPDGRMEVKAEGFITSNGLAWSPDGRTLYHSDSRQQFLQAWDFDAASGGLSRHRELIRFTEAGPHPDGAAMDVNGIYWSADPFGGQLMRITPDGRLLEPVMLPIPAPTMPCFAGEWLYVTSLRINQDEESLRRHPTLGGIFRLKAPVAGAAVGVFAD